MRKLLRRVGTNPGSSPDSAPPSSTSGVIRVPIERRVYYRPDKVIETVFFGHVQDDQVTEVSNHFFKLIQEQGVKTGIWLVDALAVDDYDKSVFVSGAFFLDRYKNTGGKKLVLITTNNKVRLIGTTLALMRMSTFKIVATRDEAEAYIKILHTM